MSGAGDLLLILLITQFSLLLPGRTAATRKGGPGEADDVDFLASVQAPPGRSRTSAASTAGIGDGFDIFFDTPSNGTQTQSSLVGTAGAPSPTLSSYSQSPSPTPTTAGSSWVGSSFFGTTGGESRAESIYKSTSNSLYSLFCPPALSQSHF